jgi:hypothetical protein
MKTLFYSITLLICTSFISLAQQRSFQGESKSGIKSNSSSKKKKEYIYPSNVVKLNVPSLLFKTVALQYERKLTKRFSLALGLMYRPKSSFFLYKFMADSASSFGLGPETAQMLRTARYSSLSFTPELRYYFKKRAPKGLYLAPFLRLRREVNSFAFNYDETNVNPSVRRTGLVDIRENTFGGGLLFGYHLVSKKKFAIDFWFAGPWVGTVGTKITAPINTANINSFDKAIIESKLANVTNLDQLDWTSKGIETKTNRSGIGFRMFGINLGWNF